MQSDTLLIEQASRAFSNQEYEQALDIILPMVDAANPAATGMLGLAYQHGKGVEQDSHKAVALMQRAVELGDAYSAHNLGRLYMHGVADIAANIELSNVYYNLAKEMGLQYESETDL